MIKKTVIIELANTETNQGVLYNPSAERILGRVVSDWSPYCGTYGQGGPGFIGFKLKATDKYPEEWLILCIWGAGDWLTVNGRWLDAHIDQHQIQRPLFAGWGGKNSWDELKPLVVDQPIKEFDVQKRSMRFRIGGAAFSLSEDSSERPPYPACGPREVGKDDDLRAAWILSPVPWVEI